MLRALNANLAIAVQGLATAVDKITVSPTI